MDKIKQIVLICENGDVITDDGTKFQVVEVNSETVMPDYSHLIGKWVRSMFTFRDKCFIENNWYLIIKPINDSLSILDENAKPNGTGDNTECFDLSNPLDYNPTSLVGKYYKSDKIGKIIKIVFNGHNEPCFFIDGAKNVKCSEANPSAATDTPPVKSLRYDDIVNEMRPLFWIGNLFVHRHSDARKLRATAQLLVVMHAANGGEWIPKEGEKSYAIYYSKVSSLCVSEQEIVLYQIYFRTREDAEKALANNKQLFNEYFGIDE